MKKNFLIVAICLIFLGGLAALLGIGDYNFSKQEELDSATMKLEDYEKGQRISTAVKYAYGYYAYRESYNTFLGVKTTKSKEEERYYLVPVLKRSDATGYDYIDYFMTYIVPADQCEEFERLVAFFWGGEDDVPPYSFTGKVEKMDNETHDLLLEYFNTDYDVKNDPGVSEYQFLIDAGYFEGESITPEYIESRLANYCIRYRGDTLVSGLVALGIGGVLFVSGVLVLVLGIVKKKNDAEPPEALY